MSSYRAPDFTEPGLANAPDARFVPAPANGVLPDDFFSTTNLPTYVKVRGVWTLPRHPRMDSGIVLRPDASLDVVEGRYISAGDPVAIGFADTVGRSSESVQRLHPQGPDGPSRDLLQPLVGRSCPAGNPNTHESPGLGFGRLVFTHRCGSVS
jgi:hypothetical protein